MNFSHKKRHFLKLLTAHHRAKATYNYSQPLTKLFNYAPAKCLILTTFNALFIKTPDHFKKAPSIPHYSCFF